MLGWSAVRISVFKGFWLSGLQERQKSVFFAAPPGKSSLGQREAKLSIRQSESSDESSAPESEKESLNFKVSSQFKKAFKGFAVSEGISMTDLLKEGFVLSKKKRQK
jgi:hypothetical protein